MLEAKGRGGQLLFGESRETGSNYSLERPTEIFLWGPVIEAALRENTLFSYGDGPLAPHEWIRKGDGMIFKADAEGHASDHTLVGEQSLLWDIAGAIIERKLNSQTAPFFVRAIEARGLQVHLEAPEFYRVAYAAFRGGLPINTTHSMRQPTGYL